VSWVAMPYDDLGRVGPKNNTFIKTNISYVCMSAIGMCDCTCIRMCVCMIWNSKNCCGKQLNSWLPP